MSEQVAGGVDAAAVGLALAFPEGLQGHLAAMADAWAPVDEAVAASSAGLVELGLLTAGLNGSVAVARPVGAGRAHMLVREDAAVPGAGLLREQSGGGLVAVQSGQVGKRGADTRALSVGAGAAPIAAALAGVGDRESEAGGVDASELLPQAAVAVGGSESVAPIGSRPGSGAMEFAATSNGTPGQGRADAVAPAIERAATVTKSAFGSAPAGFNERGWSSGSVSSVAPVAGGRAGLRADVGRALQEREAVRGLTIAAPELGGGPSAASAVGRARGSRGGLAGSGVGEGPGGPGLEAAWAPQPAERGSGGTGGQGMGSVMLDGRLVGHWMSEGMARDAARPGAGTTSFDARQAPAWTPSGAL